MRKAAFLLVLLAGTFHMSADNYLTVQDINIQPGETQTVTVGLENSTVYSAFQLDIVLPEGISIAVNKKGKPVITLEEDRIEDHTASTNMRDEHTAAVGVISMTSGDFYENSGPLFYFDITADADFGGEALLQLANVFFFESTGAQTQLPDVSCRLYSAIAAESITLNMTEIQLTVGDYSVLTAVVAPANATDKTVSWTSSDTSVATVDTDGKVTGVAAGTATITATCGEASAECQVTVKDIEPCQTPTIAINDDGHIVVTCDTEGAQLHTTVECADIDTFHHASGQPVEMTGQYMITSYATADGLPDSEPAKAMLVWAKLYDDTTGIDRIESSTERAMLISSAEGTITIHGTVANEPVEIYDLDGTQLYAGSATEGTFTIPTALIPGAVYILHIGSRSIKILL